jgi:hypothetical protein
MADGGMRLVQWSHDLHVLSVPELGRGCTSYVWSTRVEIVLCTTRLVTDLDRSFGQAADAVILHIFSKADELKRISSCLKVKRQHYISKTLVLNNPFGIQCIIKALFESYNILKYIIGLIGGLC